MAEWELLLREINAALNPLIERREYYREGLIAFRKLLEGYFFNDALVRTLVEAAGPGEQIFDFSAIKDSMKACLSDENALLHCACESSLWTEARTLSLAGALDTQVAASTLPLRYDERAHYSIEFNPPFTGKAQAFMRQFAYGLSLYRVYLSVFDVYYNLFSSDFLNVAYAKSCLEYAGTLRGTLPENAEPDTLIRIWKEAKTAKKHIKPLLNPLRDEHLRFEQTFLQASSSLISLFDRGAKQLEESYRAYPNTSVTFMLRDTAWQVLLKQIAVNLFQNHYTWSTMRGTLTILPAFTKRLVAEITRFYDVVLDRQLDYKSELMLEAIGEHDGTLRSVRKQATRLGLALIEAPVQGRGSVLGTFGHFAAWPVRFRYAEATASSSTPSP
ncbi:hypothetical protein [Legionella sp. CNM-4043-24]|uniref:hypothetical protein n=1 Tax=Legionella sp. CNM-4043-24 TaxID=3421646 RepID=UPI00403AF33C